VESGESVRETVSRETVEGTGLIVESVNGEFDELLWTSSSSGRENVQFNYAVTVAQPMEIRLNPEEHSDWRWANQGDINSLEMTPAMNKILKDAFTYSRKHMV
jgi:ADP-ribose pyrophosphatase YjhB (NUDIX family)